MHKYDDMIDLIYEYYPQKCRYSSDNYNQSIENLKYSNVLKDSKRRMQIRDKSYACIKSVFKEYHITYWNHTHDYPSVHYSVLLHKSQSILDDDEELLDALNGRRLDLEIYISLLGNYFYTYIIETTRSLPQKELHFDCYSEEQFVDSHKRDYLTKEMFSIGFTKLDSCVAHADVPNIETELLYEGEVKIFNCLFSDMEKNF